MRGLVQECPVLFPGADFLLPGGQKEEGEGAQVFLTMGTFSQGKQTLLPLHNRKEKTVIFPWDPTIQAAEMRNVVRMARRAGPQILLEAGI